MIHFPMMYFLLIRIIRKLYCIGKLLELQLTGGMVMSIKQYYTLPHFIRLLTTLLLPA